VLYERHKSSGLNIIGVNLAESSTAVRAWKQEFALTFPLVMDSAGTVARDYRLRGQPTTVIVAPGGTVTHIFYGPAALPALEAAVIDLLPVQSTQDTP
jgi:peroxiredoxin